MKDTFTPKYDINQLNRILSDLKMLDLRKTKYDEVYKIINDIFTDIVTQIIFCPITPIFRARINNNTSFSKVESLIYPKPYKLKKYGRLTKPHNPILYASSKIDTAIFEIQPELNDIVTVIQFDLEPQFKNLQTYEIGVREKFFHEVPHVLERSGNFNYSHDYKQIHERIESFFNEQFSLIVGENEKYKYKITAAISEMLFLKNDFAECLIYPSVACSQEEINVGIKPDIFLTKFKPKGVAEFKIQSKSFVSHSKEYDAICISKTNKIHDNGLIEW